jgi:NitT/TauT family transport system ATP-binding protein
MNVAATMPKDAPVLRVAGHAKSFGAPPREVRAIDELTFEVGEREIVCVVGPSGAGKTTLLKCIGGLMMPSAGSVTLDGTAISGPPERLAIVFQDYSRSLMPWFTVEGNVILPLRGKGLSRGEMRTRANEALRSVGLDHAAGRYPWQLSGGMQQRVAIARALALDPAIVLMDEPFSALDHNTRTRLRQQIVELWQETRKTILFVTHDIDEAIYLGDRIVVLSRSPTRVLRRLEVDLPKPRHQIETKAEPRFSVLRAELLALLGHAQHAPTTSATPTAGREEG